MIKSIIASILILTAVHVKSQWNSRIDSAKAIFRMSDTTTVVGYVMTYKSIDNVMNDLGFSRMEPVLLLPYNVPLIERTYTEYTATWYQDKKGVKLTRDASSKYHIVSVIFITGPAEQH